MTHSRTFPLAARRGHSLVEVLVSIVLIVALVALVLMGAGKMREAGNNIRCVSNMRSIGLAIHTYANDHNGVLPHLADGQRLGYSLSNYSDQFHIPRALGAYLQLPPAVAGAAQFAEGIACPSWLRELDKNGNKLTTPCFVLRSIVIDGQSVRPFGKTSNPVIEPMRLNAFEKPASVPVLSDIDAVLISSYAGMVPPRPAHGNHRNTLYLDGHVSAISTTD